MSNKKEVNGNNNYVPGGKRKNNCNKKTGNGNINPGLKPFDNIPMHPFCPTNHRIYPSVSDPTLCYPYINYSLPIDPITSYNLHQPYSFPNHSMFNNPSMNYYKSQESEFTSLPYVNNDFISDSDSKRRLSDPCIPNESDVNNESANVEQLVRSLVEQVQCLKDSNRRMYRELQEMRSEMNFLRQQCTMRYYDKEYEPGMLSDIVREIRDAARVREEALLSRVKHMIEERHLAMNHLHLLSEKAKNNERLGKLEEQMKTLCINNSIRENGTSVDNTSAEQVLELEQDTLALRRELQEVIASKKDADAKIQKLDQLVASLQQKLTANEISAQLEDVKTSSISTENCSITTKSASPIARVVMSGPVTSL